MYSTTIPFSIAIAQLLLAGYYIFDGNLSQAIAHLITSAIFLTIFMELQFRYLRRLVAYIQDQIYFRHLARFRRASYIQFRESVKGGTLKTDEFEPEAKRVIK